MTDKQNVLQHLLLVRKTELQYNFIPEVTYLTLSEYPLSKVRLKAARSRPNSKVQTAFRVRPEP